MNQEKKMFLNVAKKGGIHTSMKMLPCSNFFAIPFLYLQAWKCFIMNTIWFRSSITWAVISRNTELKERTIILPWSEIAVYVEPVFIPKMQHNSGREQFAAHSGFTSLQSYKFTHIIISFSHTFKSIKIISMLEYLNWSSKYSHSAAYTQFPKPAFSILRNPIGPFL